MSINVDRSNYKSYGTNVKNMISLVSSLESQKFSTKNVNDIKQDFASIRAWEDPVGELFKQRINTLNNTEYNTVCDSVTKGNFKTLKQYLQDANSAYEAYNKAIIDYDASVLAYEKAKSDYEHWDENEDYNEYDRGNLLRTKRDAESAMKECERLEKAAKIEFNNALNILATVRFEGGNYDPVVFKPEQYIEEPMAKEVLGGDYTNLRLVVDGQTYFVGDKLPNGYYEWTLEGYPQGQQIDEETLKGFIERSGSGTVRVYRYNKEITEDIYNELIELGII